MEGPAKIITYIAVSLMAGVAVIGVVLAAGSASSDLTTGQLIGTTAPWLVIGLGLSAFAYWSHRIAPWVSR